MPKGRIAERFKDLDSKGEKALISYVMSGFPTERSSVAAIRGLIEGGADIIELGFPFSDPLADGPAIQHASTTSLKGGATLDGFLRMAKRIRQKTETPLILMTYTNILYNVGYDKAVSQIVDSGIDGIILPDMSVDESASYIKAAQERVDTIFLTSPNTPADRLQRIAKISSGFLYMVAVYGTTGVRAPKTKGGSAIAKYALDAVRRTKIVTNQFGIPLGVGFGVSTPRDVKKYVDVGADAVIVGSAYTHIIREAPRNEIENRVATFTRQLKLKTRCR